MPRTDLHSFDSLPADARAWVYQCSRGLTDAEVSVLNAHASEFVKDWKAHGHPLSAVADVLYNRFLLLAVDERGAHASGCSIDSSVAFVRRMEQQLGTEFLSRMELAYLDTEGAVRTVHALGLEAAWERGELRADTTVFNNMVTTCGGLRNAWRIPLSQSWAAQRLPIAQ